MLTVERLGMVFETSTGPRTALSDVRFTVARGGAFGLVGESGSGKSTVLRCIVGLLKEWTGTIRLDGATLGAKRTLAHARRVQMVFQDPYGSLHPRHSVETALGEPIAIHALDQRDDRIDAALDAVGLDASYRRRFPHELSGGQRQRVAIARALIVEPRLVLLDEPTSALDVSIQAEVLNLLKDLREDHGLTYVLVSHDLAVVRFLCDTIGIMHNGQLLEVLAADHLLHPGPRSDYGKALLAASLGPRS
jgi:peptide/nickel transport system ATP-binding protein